MSIKLLLSALLMLIISSCSNKSGTSFYYEVKQLSFKFEPPYAGAETKFAEVVVNIDSACAANKADTANLQKVTLDKLVCVMDSGKNFDLFGGLTVELQSDNTTITTLTAASVTEVTKGKQEITFSGSEEKNVVAFLKEKKFNVLLSTNLNSTDTAAYTIVANLTFKITAHTKK